MTAISVSGWISIRNATLDYSDQNPIFWANEQPFNTTQLRLLNLIDRFQMDQICMLSIGLDVNYVIFTLLQKFGNTWVFSHLNSQNVEDLDDPEWRG